MQLVEIPAPGVNLTDVLGYIQQNGVMVSERWHIGQEALLGNDLVLRDVISSIGGIDARYTFTAGDHTDL